MNRIDVITSSSSAALPHATDARRGSLRTLLLAIPLALMLAAAFTAPVFAATGTKTESGYKQKPPAPKEKPTSGTAPAKEESKPAASTSPTASTSSSSSTLPFTGLDLGWVIGGGVLLLGAGVSIRVVQRRARHSADR